MSRYISRFHLFQGIYETAIIYPAPSNLTYWWNFGIYALLALGVQFISGIFLAMHYVPDISLAFVSVEHIMRDVNYGALLRYVHANGASFFFIVVYLHIFRGIYYASYTHPRQGLWCTGVVILLLMILTAFLGYVLPWGQMSFWGATVITNLSTAIPFIGNDLVFFIWGAYAIDNATLTRFFSLHYLLPFVILALVLIHLFLLHENKSNNPLGISANLDSISFFPYYIIKDLYGVILYLYFFSTFVFFFPNLLGHPDNYIPANPLVTPPHIVPEWYFLPFYSILRSIPDKLVGVIALLAAILVLLILPFIHKPTIRSMDFKPISKSLFSIFIMSSFLLGWIGSKPVETPFVEIGQYAALAYFTVLLLFLQICENIKNLVVEKDAF